MAATTMLDLRRTDLRRNILFNPYWISSSEIGPAMQGPNLMIIPTAQDKAAVLFNFSTPGMVTQVHQVVIQVEVAFTASTAITVGYGTIPTDLSTTGATVTLPGTGVEYILAADITPATPGYYIPTTAHTSTWLTSAQEGTVTMAVFQFIVGAASAVPCVIAFATNPGGAGSMIAGRARVHMLISEFPGVTELPQNAVI